MLKLLDVVDVIKAIGLQVQVSEVVQTSKALKFRDHIVRKVNGD